MADIEQWYWTMSKIKSFQKLGRWIDEKRAVILRFMDFYWIIDVMSIFCDSCRGNLNSSHKWIECETSNQYKCISLLFCHYQLRNCENKIKWIRCSLIHKTFKEILNGKAEYPSLKRQMVPETIALSILWIPFYESQGFVLADQIN